VAACEYALVRGDTRTALEISISSLRQPDCVDQERERAAAVMVQSLFLLGRGAEAIPSTLAVYQTQEQVPDSIKHLIQEEEEEMVCEGEQGEQDEQDEEIKITLRSATTTPTPPPPPPLPFQSILEWCRILFAVIRSQCKSLLNALLHLLKVGYW
jgi:hypothetical protein